MAEENGEQRIRISVSTWAWVAVVVFMALVGNVVSNDRMRSSEDDRIEKLSNEHYAENKDCIKGVDIRLARIEAKLDMILQKGYK